LRILLWHGWVLEGSGSNVHTAKVTEVYRRAGHDVVLVCQEPHPDRFGFVDGWGSVDRDGVRGPKGRESASPRLASGRPAAEGRVILLRPDIGSLLPVFVYDEYEGFEVKRFVDLSDEELERYLERNVAALRAAFSWHRSEVVIAGHAVPGPVVARRALGPGSYVAKVHGSDLEYAIRLQGRYLELAREGLQGARAVIGATEDVLRRTVEMIPSIAGRTRAVPPGVEVDVFRHRPRREAIEAAAARLEAEVDASRGRPSSLDLEVERAVGRRDAQALDDLARRYDQEVPDQEVSVRLRALAGYEGPLVGYIGKLIPQKGVELLLAALPLLRRDVRVLIIGFGLGRERLAAMAIALDRGDAAAARWAARSPEIMVELSDAAVADSRGIGARITFTGRLDHRFAPFTLAALDVLVVPSVLGEAFGMVAAEGAAAGALPLVARHSGLAEAADAMERAAGVPGLFSFEPGPDAPRRIAEALGRLISLPSDRREQLRAAVSLFVSASWTWERTAEGLLQAALPLP
jgi:glycosyltransferase involved in cell wall biosynthesis